MSKGKKNQNTSISYSGLQWNDVCRIVKALAYKYFIANHASKIEDFTQDALLKILLNLHKFDPNSSKITTWSYAIANHYFIDLIRSMERKKLDFEYLEYVYQLEYLSSSETNSEALEILEKRIATLAPQEQELLLYKYDQNLSARSIAQLTNLPENQVPVYLQRIRRKLKKSYF